MKNLIVALIIGAGVAQAMGGAPQKNSLVAEEKRVASTNAAVPAALVGEWQSGSLVAENFYDSNTQQWREPHGRGMFLIVQPNGGYRFGAGEQIAATQYFIYQEGTVAIQGSQVVFAPQAGSEFARDNKTTQHASSKDALQVSTFTFQIVQHNDSSTQLVMIDEHGEIITLQRSAQ